MVVGEVFLYTLIAVVIFVIAVLIVATFICGILVVSDYCCGTNCLGRKNRNESLYTGMLCIYFVITYIAS